MSTHNIGFYEEKAKLSLNHHQISSNTHLISSAENNIRLKFSVNSLEQEEINEYRQQLF